MLRLAGMVMVWAVNLWGVNLGFSSEMTEARLVGDWLFSLETPGGELEFRVAIDFDQDSLKAEIINGPERIPVAIRVPNRNRISLEFSHYASSIELSRRESDQWSGHWVKRRGPGAEAQVPCEARRIDHVKEPEGFNDLRDAYLGRWAVTFADSPDPAVGVFERFGSSQVSGTFLTTTGDYRFLIGRVDQGGMTLSCFDGAHAFLFKARRSDAGLTGEFWSGNWYHDSWTARPDPDAGLPDGFELTILSGKVSLKDMQFPDLDGNQVSLGAGQLLGKVTLVEIFGSWCPNCHDEAQYLAELERRYSASGLKVVGLAFELTGDFQRDATQVRRYVERFDVGYPVLLAGISDKAEASKQFPVLDRIRSFPTTLFVDQGGAIRAIYTGFSGPATGEAHTRLKSRFEAIIKRLLAE